MQQKHASITRFKVDVIFLNKKKRRKLSSPRFYEEKKKKNLFHMRMMNRKTRVNFISA